MQKLRQGAFKTTTPILHRLIVTFIATGNIFNGAINTLATHPTCTTYRPFASICQSNNSEMSAPAAESYTAGSSSVAFVTTPDENLAKKLAQGLVEKKLAACVNIIPQIQSIYMWEGKVNEDNECLMMIKTRTSRLEELIKFVRENHSYSVAEVITLPIENGNAPYLSWIAQTVSDKQ